MRRIRVLGASFGMVWLLVGCGSGGPQPGGPQRSDDTPPWKVGVSGDTVTAAPDAGGPLSAGNCPTLAEATAAVSAVTAGPDGNGVPFKTMVLQCNYSMQELDVQGRPAGIGILVFDASAEGIHLWDTVRADPSLPNPTDVPGLAEVAFATGATGHFDLWVVQGRFGFHMSHTRQTGVPLDQMVALARATLIGLSRPPR